MIIHTMTPTVEYTQWSINMVGYTHDGVYGLYTVEYTHDGAYTVEYTQWSIPGRVYTWWSIRTMEYTRWSVHTPWSIHMVDYTHGGGV